jgi:uncharacterized protein (DUF1697 family)
MPRHVAFLRGVSPTVASSAALKHAFESAGFANVRTVLSSGNVAFDHAGPVDPGDKDRIETTLERTIGRRFETFLRSSADLRKMLSSDPFAAFPVPSGAKRVVTFLGDAGSSHVPLPLAADGASVYGRRGREAFSAYTPTPKGPVFMKLIEKAFGIRVTTRTWDTVKKCAAA